MSVCSNPACKETHESVCDVFQPAPLWVGNPTNTYLQQNHIIDPDSLGTGDPFHPQSSLCHVPTSIVNVLNILKNLGPSFESEVDTDPEMTPIPIEDAELVSQIRSEAPETFDVIHLGPIHPDGFIYGPPTGPENGPFPTLPNFRLEWTHERQDGLRKLTEHTRILSRLVTNSTQELTPIVTEDAAIIKTLSDILREGLPDTMEGLIIINARLRIQLTNVLELYTKRFTTFNELLDAAAARTAKLVDQMHDTQLPPIKNQDLTLEDLEVNITKSLAEVPEADRELFSIVYKTTLMEATKIVLNFQLETRNTMENMYKLNRSMIVKAHIHDFQAGYDFAKKGSNKLIGANIATQQES